MGHRCNNTDFNETRTNKPGRKSCWISLSHVLLFDGVYSPTFKCLNRMMITISFFLPLIKDTKIFTNWSFPSSAATCAQSTMSGKHKTSCEVEWFLEIAQRVLTKLFLFIGWTDVCDYACACVYGHLYVLVCVCTFGCLYSEISILIFEI